ncbi:hypothetical protein NL676_018710 [Syzygium grande]|nr:hypothetical protein NL676_018710 [Syzygium grande]
MKIFNKTDSKPKIICASSSLDLNNNKSPRLREQYVTPRSGKKIENSLTIVSWPSCTTRFFAISFCAATSCSTDGAAALLHGSTVMGSSPSAPLPVTPTVALTLLILGLLYRGRGDENGLLPAPEWHEKHKDEGVDQEQAFHYAQQEQRIYAATRA